MTTAQPILCAVDFSEASYQAIQKASLFAQLMQADLTLVHAIHVLPQTFGVLRQQDAQSQSLLAEAHEQARDLLRQAKKAYIPYAVTSKSIIGTHSWKDTLLATAMETNPYLIVIPPTETFSRQDIQSILTQANCPVLVFPQQEMEEVNSRSIKKMLLMGDADYLTEEWKDLVEAVFSLMNTEAYLVVPAKVGLRPSERDLVRKQTESCCHKLEEVGFSQVQFQIVEGTPDPIRLQEIAVQMGCDLMMLVPEKRDTQTQASDEVQQALTSDLP